MRIGGAEVASPIWLAPLAGVTNATFRAWHRRMGAGLVHTEMVSAVGLAHASGKTERLLGPRDEPGPAALQLFAPDADSLERGAEIALGLRGYVALEVNMACPMPKVAKKGCGAALLDRPDDAREMTRRLARFRLPVWVKTRLPGRRPLTAEAFAGALIDAGASLVMIHGRTPEQRYEGAADREAVGAAARAHPGMIAASGDFYEPEDAIGYLDGGAAAVLAARGAIRDAYLVARTNAALGLAEPCEPTIADRLRAVTEIGRMGLANEGERSTLVLVRRMLSGLFRGFPGASAIRQACASCASWAEFDDFLRGEIAKNGQDR